MESSSASSKTVSMSGLQLNTLPYLCCVYAEWQSIAAASGRLEKGLAPVPQQGDGKTKVGSVVFIVLILGLRKTNILTH